MSKPPFGHVDRAALSIDVVDREEWQHLTTNGRTNIWPEHWPKDVRCISFKGTILLGLDSKGHLYLDGDRLYTERRLGRQERILAWIVACAAIIAASAACISAWADFVQIGSK